MFEGFINMSRPQSSHTKETDRNLCEGMKNRRCDWQEYCEVQAIQDPIIRAEARRYAQNMYGMYSQATQWPAPPKPRTLGPNQIAWCKEHLRGFSMEGE